ncbi:hypothetical protein E2I00_007920, partial [Balaenoptera physalus]
LMSEQIMNIQNYKGQTRTLILMSLIHWPTNLLGSYRTHLHPYATFNSLRHSGTVITGFCPKPKASVGRFLSPGAPVPLIPVLVIIETISLFIQPIAYSITAGHLSIHLIRGASLSLLSVNPPTALIRFMSCSSHFSRIGGSPYSSLHARPASSEVFITHKYHFSTPVLLASAVPITQAQDSLIEGNCKHIPRALFITISLVYFTLLQASQYYKTAFTISDGVHRSTVFITKGFHGLHVIIGSTFPNCLLPFQIISDLKPLPDTLCRHSMAVSIHPHLLMRHKTHHLTNIHSLKSCTRLSLLGILSNTCGIDCIQNTNLLQCSKLLFYYIHATNLLLLAEETKRNGLMQDSTFLFYSLVASLPLLVALPYYANLVATNHNNPETHSKVCRVPIPYIVLLRSNYNELNLLAPNRLKIAHHMLLHLALPPTINLIRELFVSNITIILIGVKIVITAVYTLYILIITQR